MRSSRKRNTSQRTREENSALFQNVLLIWVDSNIDLDNQDVQHTLTQLRSIIYSIETYSTLDDAIARIEEIQNEAIYLITSGAIGASLVPQIHHRSQVRSIFVFCEEPSHHVEWGKQWGKVSKVENRIEPICDSLRLDLHQFNRDATPISIIPGSFNAERDRLDELEPSFMYTQLLKDTLISIQYDQDEQMQRLVNALQRRYSADAPPSDILDAFQRDYEPEQAIWWYTKESFAYGLLNKALRELRADIIIDMGFFLRDMHRQISERHKQQLTSDGGKTHIVYRGQRLTIDSFNQLKANKGGLLSFNSFLSTSTQRGVARFLAESSLSGVNHVGILFVIEIDPNHSRTPFASINDISAFGEEAEILFSMHSVFRIGEVTPLGQLFEVKLQLTNDDDPQLRMLTKHIEQQVADSNEWGRLAYILIETGAYEKAQELYEKLLENESDSQNIAFYYHQLGVARDMLGDQLKALEDYQKALEIYTTSSLADDRSVATSYNNIAGVHSNRGDQHKALDNYRKSLAIYKKLLPSNHADLAGAYNNIGNVYLDMGDYGKALRNHQESLEIYQRSLPANHPSLGASYHNIASVYSHMDYYDRALQNHQQSLEIRKKSLPANHPDLAISYSSIGLLYSDMGEYDKALQNHQQALEIREASLLAHHLDLATSYNNIGLVHYYMRDYGKALEYYDRAVHIHEKSRLFDHAHLASSYSNIGNVYSETGEYAKALEFHDRCLKIRQKSLNDDHPDLARSYNNIGLVYKLMQDYTKALEYYEKDVEITKKITPCYASRFSHFLQQHRQCV
jgi:tetratricopeptide (TPR) repeat protein